MFMLASWWRDVAVALMGMVRRAATNAVTTQERLRGAGRDFFSRLTP